MTAKGSPSKIGSKNSLHGKNSLKGALETESNPNLQIVKKESSGKSTTISKTLEDFDLGGVDCPICHNTGRLPYMKNGELYSRDCECMAKRLSLRRIRNSNMSDMLMRYTFERYETPDASRAKVKQSAEAFCEADKGWFFIAGQSGSGKTHICTAICSKLMERGLEVYYMAWRDESRKLKAMMNTEELEDRLDKLKRVDVLYIDDFLKGGCNDADIRLAFELINARYNDTRLRTIISTEATIETILSIDEALGGRIKERSNGFIGRGPKQNWRLR